MKRGSKKAMWFFLIPILFLALAGYNIYEEYLMTSQPAKIQYRKVESRIIGVESNSEEAHVTCSVSFYNSSDMDVKVRTIQATYAKSGDPKDTKNSIMVRGTWADPTIKTVVLRAKAVTVVECIFVIKEYEGDISIDQIYPYV